MSDFSLADFQTLLQALEDKLNALFPCNSDVFKAIEDCCHAGIKGPHHRHPRGEIDLIMP